MQYAEDTTQINEKQSILKFNDNVEEGHEQQLR